MSGINAFEQFVGGCEINVGPKRIAVTARRITLEDADYPRLWKLVNKNNANRYTG